MLGIPIKQIALSSAVLSYGLVALIPRLDGFQAYNATYLGSFFLFVFLQLVSWAGWKILIYPKYFSPLRHLPGPKVR